MKRLILPELPPSVNHMYTNRRTKEGRRMRVLKPNAQRWFDNTVIQTNLWRNRTHWKTAQGKVIVRLWFYFPDLRKRDTHNGLKALMDAFEDALIYENDMYALPRVMDFEVDREHPRLEIEFEEVGL